MNQNLGRDVNCDKLDEGLAKLNLDLIVDPQGLAAINETDQTFAYKYTPWDHDNDNYRSAIFHRWVRQA